LAADDQVLGLEDVDGPLDRGLDSNVRGNDCVFTDALKLIPQGFFDLIARMVPGAVAIVVAQILRSESWESDLERVFGPSIAASATASVTLFLGAAYISGQLISPLAKLMQRVGERRMFKPKPKSPSGAYDWLRTHQAEAGGAHSAKIRGEFTMHNGLAVVLIAAAALYPFGVPDWSWPVQAALVVGAALAAIRGRTTRDTFHETVTKFADAAGFAAGDHGGGHTG
jgi:hypothetical protein